MKLYYTVSSGYLQPQANFINSLGGYPSSTPVPNDVFGNLFDEISISEIREAKTQYRAVILHNDSKEIASKVELWFEALSEDIVSEFQIGATMLTVDGETQYMESVDSSYSKPFYTQLYSATIDNKVSVGDMAPDQMIGIWISRKINKEKAVEDYNNVAERDLSTQSRYKPIEKIKEEGVNLQISWQ